MSSVITLAIPKNVNLTRFKSQQKLLWYYSRPSQYATKLSWSPPIKTQLLRTKLHQPNKYLKCAYLHKFAYLSFCQAKSSYGLVEQRIKAILHSLAVHGIKKIKLSQFKLQICYY